MEFCRFFFERMELILSDFLLEKILGPKSERIKAGIEKARKYGKRIGRPRSHNYDEILRLRAEGLSYSQIQKKTNCSRPAIPRALGLRK